jgi:Kef-type K+ transport system membrane component KefB
VKLDVLGAPLLQLFVQLPAILACCWLGRRAAHAIGQPGVIGEMAAGIAIGPSLLGVLAPAAQSALFPPESRGALFLLSQIGLVFYMFLVGLEFNPALLSGFGGRAAAISAAGVVVPLALAAGLVPLLQSMRLLNDSVPWRLSALFVGVSLAITAFPVLARILQEERLTQSHIGTLALAAAAVDDVTAWSLLALILAMLKGQLATMAITIAGSAAYVLLALLVVRPALARAFPKPTESLSVQTFTAVVILLFVSALCAERLGLHVVFGGFMAGVVFQGTGLAASLRARTEDFVQVVLLPLFFTYSGLNTRIGLLNSSALWLLALFILAVATLGKLGGCAVAARLCGMGWRTAFGLGALMNARGLVELIVLNIGLEQGILTPDLFTVMVLMAIATTMLARPLLNLTHRHQQPVAYRAASPLA